MKLAVSSLAWEPARDDDVRRLLSQRGVSGVELAPLKYWPSLADVVPHEVAEYRRKWADAGISIVAFQAILFGMPHLQLFGSAEQQAALENHLIALARVAELLGAQVLVFGAPKNRLRGALSEDDAIAQATPLLRRVATVMHGHGCALCIEPNPPRYGGDFVRTSVEALRLVRAVDNVGFGLHLDTGALTISDASDEEVGDAARQARHLHISEIDLVPVGGGTVDHARLGTLLRGAGYDRWASIEMRAVPDESLVAVVEEALDVASGAYL
jgi:D-psicose/D-tagatose/L-ribulose 3-epimerase